MDQELSWRLLLANPGAVGLSIKTRTLRLSPTRTSFQSYGECDHFYSLLYRSQSDSMVTSPFVLLGGRLLRLCCGQGLLAGLPWLSSTRICNSSPLAGDQFQYGEEQLPWAQGVGRSNRPAPTKSLVDFKRVVDPLSIVSTCPLPQL